ncbi:hypothetical protein [Novosphingobium sp.]|uniref:hypothetical protein n=1 Tax=Novosphingobium sp. TaxID=1874826 RepID=UPI00262D761E|nr:hypothetical protein [Novosphingobium sp.]
MRSIDVSVGVFAQIWALRIDGEDNEDQILSRILRVGSSKRPKKSTDRIAPPTDDCDISSQKILWREDIVHALENLGGSAELSDIYKEVRKIRREGNRTLPPSTEAVIRRELENNSSDSESFTGTRNLFRSVNGIGQGHWALRI